MDPNLQIRTNVGCKELLLRKLSYAVTSSVLSQVIILFVFIVLISINLLHPVEWLLQVFGTVTSLSTWIFAVPFLSIIFAQTLICAKDYVLLLRHYSTRIQKFFAILSIRNLILLVLHVLIGGLTVWLFLSLTEKNYRNLYVTCKNDRYCLVRESFFLILGGLWIGLYYFLRIYMPDKRLLFPVVQQQKLPQFKARLLPLIKESQRAALLPTLYYLIFYFFFGQSIEASFMNFFHLYAQDNASVGILIYMYSWYFSALYMINMNLMRFFFEVFLTESMQFPIVTLTRNELTLTEAINISSIPIVQHLAALDLFLLSYNSRQRREMLFTLSQPGNHPHLWNSLIECTLKIIREYSETLDKSTNAVLNPEQSKIAVVPQSPIQSPLVKNCSYRNMRNMTMQNMEMPLDVITVTHKKELGFPVSAEPIINKAVEKVHAVTSALKSKLGINFLFGELPIVNIEYCLSNGQIIIWMTQSLTCLVVASLKEDKFGIVQKDIPVIVSTLVDLKQSIEKLNKIPAFTRKGQGLDDFNIKMKVAVCSAVKRSLYNICHNFGPYIKDLPLSKDVLQVLHYYIVNKNV